MFDVFSETNDIKFSDVKEREELDGIIDEVIYEAYNCEPNFNNLMEMICNYKNKYDVVDVPYKLKEHLILKYKILQIHEIKNELFIYRNKKFKLISESPSELLKPLAKIILEVGIMLPDDVTKAEIDAYDYNEKKRIESGTHKLHHYLLDYQYFNDWLTCKINRNNSFENLIKLYNIDKFDFYIACIKSRVKDEGFHTFIGNSKLKLNFNTDNFDETYHYYMKAIYNLRYSIKIMNQALRKIKINNSSLEKNANAIHFSFDEHYDFVYGDLYGLCKKDIFKNSGPAGSYWHCENVINFYYNYDIKPSKNKDKRTLFHEFGHFVNDTYNDMGYENKLSTTLESFIRKDCKLAFLNRKVLRYKRYSDYYKYSAPSLNILERKRKNLSRKSFAQELFAETVANLMIEKRAKKNRKIDPKSKYVHNMFHHTNYLVGQILKGKGVNKYKSFKK